MANDALPETAEHAGPREGGLRLESHDRELLTKWSRSQTLPVRVVTRSRIILLLAACGSVKTVAARLIVAPATVRLWRGRFDEHGPRALLHDAPGRGRKPLLDPVVRQMLQTSQTSDLPAGVRARARAFGVSAATVSRWQRRRIDAGPDPSV